MGEGTELVDEDLGHEPLLNVGRIRTPGQIGRAESHHVPGIGGNEEQHSDDDRKVLVLCTFRYQLAGSSEPP